MFRLHLIPYGTNFDIVGKSKYMLTIACIAIIVCLGSVFFKGLNYGIDFQGGYIFEVKMPENFKLNDVREKLNGIGLGEVSIQQFGSPNELSIKLEAGKDENAQIAVQKVKDALGDGVIYNKVETVGPKVGEELVSNAVKAVGFALLAMLAYIIVRFEWQFGLCAIAALFHDCCIIFGLFSLFPLEFAETSITAILLTASYSINDTVVIFDRIRENLKRYKNLDIKDLVNQSLNETLSRTTLTAMTTVLAVLALCLFGGKVIAAFSLPILIGIVIGTFSSIFVASPLLTFLKIKPKYANINKKHLDENGVV